MSSPAGQVAAGSVIAHPDTGQPVRVIATRDVAMTSPDGTGAYWRRGRVPARELTPAPDGRYAENVDVTVPAGTVLTRLDRPDSDLDAPRAPTPAVAGSAPAPPSRSPSRRDDENTRADRLHQLHATLAEQVLTLTGSQAWTDWLHTAARFHHYSFNNTVAIWTQRPDATQVAGYRTWASLGRQVRKGEHGIQILAPLTRRADAGDPATSDPATSEATGPDRGEPSPSDAPGPGRATEEPGPRQIVGVRIAYVFDYSQTDGNPLPHLQAPTLLTGQAPAHLWDGLARQVAEAGFELSNQAPPNGANGQTDWTGRRVLIRAELDPAQQVRTLAHELGHVMLHEPQDITDPDPAAACRGHREVEAESVAFLVTAAHGMDPAQYSFPYVAGWAPHSNGDDIEATLRATAGRALTTAHRILDRLDRDNPTPLVAADDQDPAEVMQAPRAGAAPPPPAVPTPGRTPEVGVSR